MQVFCILPFYSVGEEPGLLFVLFCFGVLFVFVFLEESCQQFFNTCCTSSKHFEHLLNQICLAALSVFPSFEQTIYEGFIPSGITSNCKRCRKTLKIELKPILPVIISQQKGIVFLFSEMQLFLNQSMLTISHAQLLHPIMN